jgi:hypothetical protein
MAAPDVQRFLAACLQPCWIVSVSSLTEHLRELVEAKAATAADVQRNTMQVRGYIFTIKSESVGTYVPRLVANTSRVRIRPRR